MKLGAESFTVHMFLDEEGQQSIQMEVASASVKNIYEACYTICKLIENDEIEGMLQSSTSSNNN